MARYDENGNYIVDPPQSRIEARLAKLEQLIEEGGGGGGDAPTADESDIEEIKDSVWGDDTNSTQPSAPSSNTPSGDNDEETANSDDIDDIKDSIWGN